MEARTSAQLNRRQSLTDAAAGVYRSAPCHIGQHAECPDALPQGAETNSHRDDSPPGVTFERCVCTCSHA